MNTSETIQTMPRSAGRTAEAGPQERTPLERTLHIFYGSETGTAEDLAFEDARDAADAQGLAVRVATLDRTSPDQLLGVRYALFIVSTAGDGDMPYDAQEFWNRLSGEQAPRLQHLQFGVLALGDSSYADFCGAGIRLDERLAELGGRRLLDRATCDVDYEALASAWLARALGLFADEPVLRRDDPAAEDLGAPQARSLEQRVGRPWQDAELAAKRVLTVDESDREVVHYTLDLDSPERPDWQPGDSFNLSYENDPEVVRRILLRLGLSPAAVDSSAGSAEPLGALLRHRLELRRLPRALLAEVARQDPSSTLATVLAGGSGLALERWRDGRDLLTVLEEHPEVTLDAGELLRLLRAQQPRAYSIASSPLVDASRVDLTVRTVRYEQAQREDREQARREHHGVVSGGLSRFAAEGDTLPVQHLPNAAFHLPEDPAADVIMVGPGVGVAPFRAFLQHRAARGDRGRNWLLTGIRDRATDFLYGDDFTAWHEDGLLTELDVCTSRSGRDDEYVQHRMARRGQELFDWLDGGATLYVCGDAQRMAGSVQLSVRSAAARALGSPARGEEFVARLRADRRYRQDVY